MTLPMHGNMIDCAKNRDDDWEKRFRLESCNKHVAVYHSLYVWLESD